MGKKAGGENIQVVVRCRPISSKEKDKGCKEVVSVDVGTNSVTVHNAGSPQTWTFDAVYNSSFSQSDIYLQTVNPVVENVLAGYNATVFAYGQSGTGKTHTMTGVPGTEQSGVIPRTFEHIFGHIERLQNDKKVYHVRCSMLELYNGKIRDLFSNSKRSLDIKENAQKIFFVKDLDSRQVLDGSKALQYMEEGIAKREVAATELNADSSRSHSVFTIEICCVDGEQDPPATITSKLNLVDLAGSERQTKTGATGDTLKEGCNINLSLSALGTVIDCLVKSSGHIPYRSSPLTMLLKDSLGGSAKTVMFATCGPTDMNVHETVSTLRFADRAKKIKNKPKVQMDPKDARIKELEDIIKNLKAKLGITEDVENAQATAANDSDAAMVEWQQSKEEMEEKMSNLQLDLASTRGELEREVEENKNSKHKLTEELAEVRKEVQIKAEDLQTVKDDKELLKSNYDDVVLQLVDLQRIVSDFVVSSSEVQKSWPPCAEEETPPIHDILQNLKDASDNEAKFQHLKAGLGNVSKKLQTYTPQNPKRRMSLAESLQLSEEALSQLNITSNDNTATNGATTDDSKITQQEITVDHYLVSDNAKGVSDDMKKIVKEALEAQRQEFEAERKKLLAKIVSSNGSTGNGSNANNTSDIAITSPSANVPIAVTAQVTAATDTEKAEQLQRQLEAKSQQHSKLTDDFNKLLNNFQQTDQLVQSARVELNGMHRAHEQIQAELLNKQQQLEKSREIVTKHQDMLKKKDETVAKLKDQVASLTRNLDDQIKDHKRAILDQSEKLIALQNRKLDDLQKRHEDELKQTEKEKAEVRKKLRKAKEKLQKKQTEYDELHCEHTRMMEEFEDNKMRQMKDHLNATHGSDRGFEEQRKGITMAIETQNNRVDNLMGRMFGGDANHVDKRFAHPPHSAHGHSAANDNFNMRASKTAPLKAGPPPVGKDATELLANRPPPAVPAFSAGKAPLPPMGTTGNAFQRQ